MTEQTMRERLRRAYFTAEGYNYDKLDHYDPVPQVSEADETIDAILSALAEPAPEMVEALVKSIRMDVLDMGYKDPDEPPQEIWDLLRAAFTAAIRKAGESQS